MPSDVELLEQYTRYRAEAAFAELVHRHTDFVYATALRVAAGDSALAEDATQEVFTKLAACGSQLVRQDTLVGWLHATTRHVTINLIRGSQRRRSREQAASTMQTIDATPAVDWDQLRPLLDEAVNHLREEDRTAVLLRFFKNQSHQEIGAQLGLSEDTARKRVERALEKLRVHFSSRGLTTTSAMLAAAISAHSAQTAPAGLAGKVVPAALASTGAASTGGIYFLTLMSLKTKIAAVVAILATLTVIIGVMHGHAQPPPTESASASAGAPPATSTNPVAIQPRQVLPPSQPAVAVAPPTAVAAPVAVAPPAATPPASSNSQPKPATTTPAINRKAADMPQDVVTAFQTAGYKLFQDPDIIAAVLRIVNNSKQWQLALDNAINQNAAIKALTTGSSFLRGDFNNLVAPVIYASPGANYTPAIPPSHLQQFSAEDAALIKNFGASLPQDSGIQAANQASQEGYAAFRKAFRAGLAADPTTAAMLENNPDAFNMVSAGLITITSQSLSMRPDKIVKVTPQGTEMVPNELTLEQVQEYLATIPIRMVVPSLRGARSGARTPTNSPPPQ